MNRKSTSTKNITNIITSGMVTVNDASIHEQIAKYQQETYRVETDKFVESIEALNNTIFASIIDWKYECTEESTLGDFMIMGYVENMYGTSAYTAHLKVNDSSSIDDVRKKLDETIFDRVPV